VVVLSVLTARGARTFEMDYHAQGISGCAPYSQRDPLVGVPAGGIRLFTPMMDGIEGTVGSFNLDVQRGRGGRRQQPWRPRASRPRKQQRCRIGPWDGDSRTAATWHDETETRRGRRQANTKKSPTEGQQQRTSTQAKPP